MTLPGGAPPSYWQHADIGSVGLPGSVTYCGGQFTISGSGADIWNNADAFQFVYVYFPAGTPCDIRALVASVEDTDSNAKAAVMIRESLEADSTHALVDVEPSAGIEFLYRTNTGSLTSVSVVANETAPNWVRLTRTNSTFTGYWSPDGTNWNQFGTASITMTNGAYVGLAVCAHDNSVLNTSVIDYVSANFLPVVTGPTIPPIANRTVNVGQTVSINSTARDTNLPPPVLAFSLLNAPPGSTLNQVNNSNAIFTWRPAVSDANTTNPVQLMVEVVGSPLLSDAQGFTINVNPLSLPTVPSFSWSNGQFTLLVTNSIIGPDYAVQKSSNLLQWNTLFITNSPPSTSFQWTDTNASTLPWQFYRIEIGPPLP